MVCVTRDIRLLNNNLFEGVFSLDGDPCSPYCEGKFYLKIIFPKDYPKRTHEVIFVIPFYHLNVNPMAFKGGGHLGHTSSHKLNWWNQSIL